MFDNMVQHVFFNYFFLKNIKLIFLYIFNNFDIIILKNLKIYYFN
jgi:hypothetical protein